MRPLARGLAVLSLATTLAAVPAAPASAALSCPAGTGPMPSPISTGVDAAGAGLAPGTVDPRWTVVSAPSPVTAGPAYATAPVGGWTNPGTAVSWITRTGTGPWAAGTYVYEREITLAPGQSAGPLSFWYAADNGVSFTFNGTAIGGHVAPPGGTSGFTTMHHLAVASPAWVSGVNRLRATVTNYEAWEGLLVWGDVEVCDTRSSCEAYGVLASPPLPGSPPLPPPFPTAAVSVRPTVTGARPAGPMARPPSPTADSDGAMLSLTESLGPIDVTAEGVYAHCALATTYRDAWGKAGAADVHVSTPLVPSFSLDVELAESEVEIWVGNAGRGDGLACRLGATVSGRAVNACETVTYGGVVVTVETGVTWGPVLRPDGMTHYGNAAVHVYVDVPSGPKQHLWIGWVDVATVVSPVA